MYYIKNTPVVSSLTKLKFLNLEGNDLTGSIPAELGSLTNLRRLALGYNQLTGCLPSALPHFGGGLALPYCEDATSSG